MTIKAAEVLFSLGTWAAEIGTTRDVLRRVLSEAGVTPAGKRSGHPLYRGRDVIAAWLAQSGANGDPDSMRPLERKTYYQAEHEKLRLQVERAELVPAIEVEQMIGKLFKLQVRGLETISDRVERDAGLTAPQSAKLEHLIDGVRADLYAAVIAATGTEDAQGEAAS